eukprot:9854333-Heterocapsa_arctica.AAC.1
MSQVAKLTMSDHRVDVKEADPEAEVSHGDMMIRHQFASLLAETSRDLVLEGLVLAHLLGGKGSYLAAIKEAGEHRRLDELPL